jgi:hypothetical protein
VLGAALLKEAHHVAAKRHAFWDYQLNFLSAIVGSLSACFSSIAVFG